MDIGGNALDADWPSFGTRAPFRRRSLLGSGRSDFVQTELSKWLTEKLNFLQSGRTFRQRLEFVQTEIGAHSDGHRTWFRQRPGTIEPKIEVG
jgi:hypothetical protein